MTGTALDYAMLVVSGVAGVQRMTREHLAIALALQLPLFVVMTKSDVAGDVAVPRPQQPQRQTEEGKGVAMTTPLGDDQENAMIEPVLDEKGKVPLLSASTGGTKVEEDTSTSAASGATAAVAASNFYSDSLLQPSSVLPNDTEASGGAMELAFQGLEKVLWASMGRKPQMVRGVEQAEEAADAIKGGNGSG